MHQASFELMQSVTGLGTRCILVNEVCSQGAEYAQVRNAGTEPSCCSNPCLDAATRNQASQSEQQNQIQESKEEVLSLQKQMQPEKEEKLFPLPCSHPPLRSKLSAAQYEAAAAAVARMGRQAAKAAYSVAAAYTEGPGKTSNSSY